MNDENLMPAFPVQDASKWQAHGMTLRDYFAAKAMQAIIAKTPFVEFPQDFDPYKKTAIGAYDYADAMLEKRIAK